MVDDTALPKKGELSVGVARQYCGGLGKRANCQVLVSLTLARGEVPLPVGLRLFLPDAWTADPERCAAAGVPEETRRAQTKPEIALAEIDRVHRRRRCASAACWPMPATAAAPPSARARRARAGLGGRHPETQNVYPAAVELLWPAAASGRPRKHPRAERGPASRPRPCWRRGAGAGSPGGSGTKGPLAARFAALRVRVAEGAQLRDGRHLPGRGGLAGRRDRASAASGSTTSPTCRRGPRSSGWPPRSRRAGSCEQAHQQLKEELGLDHFEGRSWTGLHRHALMT